MESASLTKQNGRNPGYATHAQFKSNEWHFMTQQNNAEHAASNIASCGSQQIRLFDPREFINAPSCQNQKILQIFFSFLALSIKFEIPQEIKIRTGLFQYAV